MTDIETLEERLGAVERALTDGDHDLTELDDAATLTARVADLEAKLDELTERVEELDASTQAVRGYVGNVRQVDQTVERRADAALATAEELEQRLETLEAERSSDAVDAAPGSRRHATQNPDVTGTTDQHTPERETPGERARRVMATTDGGPQQSGQRDTGGACDCHPDRGEKRRRHRDGTDRGGLLDGLRDAF